MSVFVEDIKIRTLELAGHIIRMEEVGRKKTGRPRRTWKDGIYTATSERDLRLCEWNHRRQWNMKVGRRRQTF